MNVPEHVYGVSQLTREIKRTLESAFGPMWLRGELSDVVYHRSGHLYLTFKDERATLRGVMWRSHAARLEFRAESGMDVLAFGRITVYEKGGRYQFTIDAMQPAGMGALALEFEKLKARLQAEGLFDPERKRPLPRTPRRIGVLTSESGAAVRDVLVTLARRGFDLSVTLLPVKVQGEGAAEDVARGIAAFNEMRERERPHVLIVARGGGSLEDLWAFNEELTVRAVAASAIPVIAGVGHETDTTLVDFAADHRAPTPTGAAEVATPDRVELKHRVETSGHRLARAARQAVEQLTQRVELAAGAYGLKRLPDRIEQGLQQLDDLELRAQRALDQLLRRRIDHLTRVGDRLAALSPLAVLGRGYAVVRSRDRVIKDAAELIEGEELTLRLARGEADARVERVRPEKNRDAPRSLANGGES
ncbi:MAG: Exodeoxyribonuclease 7 large subunit [Calditrichaeota bacterium]|nr:Exodeoxyribonuclease 7 large subunit [Calditrichota bacterium]